MARKQGADLLHEDLPRGGSMPLDCVRMVAADMDGTFLATDKHVPTANLRLLDRLAALGIAFVPCTGRPVSAVPDVLREHPATRYAIGANGGVVFDMRAQDYLHVSPMDKKLVLALYERVRTLDATFDVFADGEVYSERARYDAMGSLGIDEPSLAVLRRVRRPVDVLVPQILERVPFVEKVTCFWRAERDRDGIRAALEQVGGMCVTNGHPKNFELQAEGVSKGKALAWLCEHTDVPTREVVAFGDESNDLSMLSVAGVGVAMKNATKEVRATADRVTLANDDAGVAAFFGVRAGRERDA